MRLSNLILLIVMNCLWAGSLSIYKALEQHLAVGPIVTLRFGIAALMLLLCWPLLPGKNPRGWDLFKTVIMGLIVFMLGHRIQVFGNKLQSAGNSSVLMAMEPIITTVAAAIFLREHIGVRRWTGFALGMLGVAILNGMLRPDFKWAGIWASLIFISSFLCESVYSIMGKPLIERSGMMKILTLALVFGTIANLIIDGRETYHDVATLPLHLWWLILYLSTICTAIGYAVWFFVIRDTDVNVVALTVFAQPVAGIFIAYFWLREPLHLEQLWGSLAIVVGLVIGLTAPSKNQIPAIPD